MGGGDLRSLLNYYKSTNVPVGFGNAEKIRIALHLALALHYLHSSQVLHRDLKSRNVLLSEAYEAKLTDFGTDGEYVDAGVTANLGTSRWIAPEVVQGSRYDEKADMYSFGAVMAELDNYVIPYGHVDHAADGKKEMGLTLLQSVIKGEVSIYFSPASEARDPEIIAVRSMAIACTSRNPTMRPSASDAIRVLQQSLAAQQYG